MNGDDIVKAARLALDSRLISLGFTTKRKLHYLRALSAGMDAGINFRVVKRSHQYVALSPTVWVRDAAVEDLLDELIPESSGSIPTVVFPLSWAISSSKPALNEWPLAFDEGLLIDVALDDLALRVQEDLLPILAHMEPVVGISYLLERDLCSPPSPRTLMLEAVVHLLVGRRREAREVLLAAPARAVNWDPDARVRLETAVRRGIELLDARD